LNPEAIPELFGAIPSLRAYNTKFSSAAIIR
jgi:hypothetical protein